MSDLGIHLYCDADFAGDPYTLKSTSGARMNIEAANTRFPFSAGAEGQTSRAHSSTEAEVASLDKGMRERAEPCFIVWQILLGQYHEDGWNLMRNLYEDNTTCIICARTGKNATMKTLERRFGVSLLVGFTRALKVGITT